MTDRRQQNSVQNEISNKIKISIRRPVFRFVDDAVQSLKQYQEIELSGLGLAINTLVSVADILRSQGFATIKKVKTTLLLATYQRPSMPKVEIVLERAPTFEKEFDNKQRRDQEREEVRKNLEEGRKRIQDSLKTLSSQTPQ